MDGTLLGPDRRVSAENRAALSRLRARGYAIVYASGRHHRNMAMLVADIGEPEWIVASQGTVARHFRTGEIVFERGLAYEDIVSLAALANERDLGLIAYHRDAVHVERMTSWIEVYAEKAGWSPVVGPFHELAPIGFQKVLLTTDPAAIEAMRFDASFSRYHAVVTEPELLELLPPGTNKAAAASAVAKRLGVDVAQTLAFGDGNNDVELLAWAGRSVAMHHGREAAKRAARHVCPPGPPASAFARAVDLVLEDSTLR